jgi:hypothetical protein
VREFLVCTLVFAVVPMSLLNPMGGPAFVAYYIGVLAMWLVFVIAGQQGARRSLR